MHTEFVLFGSGVLLNSGDNILNHAGIILDRWQHGMICNILLLKPHRIASFRLTNLDL